MTWQQKVAEWVFGVPPAEPGQGMSPRFGHAFPWPAWALLLFCVAAGLFVAWVYWRDAGGLAWHKRWALIALRCGSIAALLFVLSEAILSIERTGLPYLVILLDDSGSMATEDQYADSQQRANAEALLAGLDLGRPTRLNLGKAFLLQDRGRFLKSLLKSHKLRLYSVADSEAPIGQGDCLQPADVDAMLPEIRKLQPRGEQSRLGDALRRVLNGLRGTLPSGILVISDGITTDGEKLAAAAAYARQKAVPVFTLALGHAEPTRDVELHNVQVEDVAFVDDPVRFSFNTTGHGFAGKKAKVVLKQKEGSEILSSREIDIGPDGRTVKQELTYTPKEVGEFDYILELVPLPKESNLANNRETRHISVRKERIRVLLVDGWPRWEYRELKFLLEREKTVELKTVLQDADPEFAQEDLFALPHIPVRKEDLFHYDVIILGDVAVSQLSGSVLENLDEFVRVKGGGLLLLAGPMHNPLDFRGTPLEKLFPVELKSVSVPAAQTPITESFRPELTVAGSTETPVFRFAESEKESRDVWQSLPGLFWMVDAPDLKPGARAWVTHPTRTGTTGKLPIICMQQFGAGKVVFHGTDETWRWRFRTGDLYFGRYWVHVVRYLSRSKLLGRDRAAELTLDRQTPYKTGDTVVLRVRFLEEKLTPVQNDGVTVIIERAGDVQRKLTLQRLTENPHVFEGQLPQVAEGNYHAWVGVPSFTEAPPSQDFKVEAPAREMRILRTDISELARTASLTQGKAYTLSNLQQLQQDIPPGLPVPLETDKPIELWDHWFIFTLFASLLTLEWLLRKRARLV